MAQVINTNVASLTAQRNLNATQAGLQTSLNRLSSGLRVNSAKDDAAGLAIAERFTTQIRGMEIARRNAADAISLSQTAEGAMQEITNNLQRVRELAVQASNYTNSSDDRRALDNEVQELIAEIDRVAKSTEFNGQPLLSGAFDTATFQIGANAGETIDIDDLVDATTAVLGKTQFAAGEVEFNPVYGVGEIEADDGMVGPMEINGVEIDAFPTAYDGTNEAGNVARDLDGAALAEAINAKSREHGVRAEYDAPELKLTSIEPNQDIEIDAVGNTGIPEDQVIAYAEAEEHHMADVNVREFEDAQLAIHIVDVALDRVNTARSEMGAYQNRFESVISNLSIAVENLSASRSRIQDADFAAETAELTRGQILQQAGTAMLAQANSMPQSVLSLLQ